MEKHVARLNTSDGAENQIFCLSEWTRAKEDGEDEFDITLTILLASGDVYGLELASQEMADLSKKLRLDVAAWAREAFTSHGRVQQGQHAFTLDQKSCGTELTWRRSEGQSKAKVKIGSFALAQLGDGARAAVMDTMLAQKEEEAESKKKLEERHDKLLADLQKAKSMLDEFASEKAKLEEELYGRFLPILQAKQDKIAELERGGGRRAGSDDGRESDDYGSCTDVDDEDHQNGEKSKRARLSDCSLNDSQNFLGI